MKRRIALMIVLLVTVLTVAGCGNSGLADYKKAVDKTDQITKGQKSGEFSMTMDFNTEGMTQEDINELNYYRNMSGSFRSVFDHSKNQGIYRNYLNLGGLGFDFDLFKNGEEMFFKLPIVGKYMKMDDIMKEAIQSTENPSTEEYSKMISDDTLETLSAEWVGMLKKEDIFKGKDIVLTTPDGEVKAKVYTITLNDSQVKALAENSINILSKDENLRNYFEDWMKKNEDQATADFDDFVAEMKAHILQDTVERFQYTAYVDIDGYIVDETVEVKIEREALEKGEPKTIAFHLEMKHWDINKDQKFEFPVLTVENTMKTDDLDQTMPNLFKDLFQTQN